MRVNKLQIITSDTCKELRKEDVILPSTYVHTFNKYANELKVNLETDTELTKEIQKDLNRVQEIIDNASKEFDSFQETASKAKDAIQNQDTNAIDGYIDDVASLQLNVAKLQKELYTDMLTKVYNRRWLADRFLSEEGVFKSPGVLIFVDLDKFKAINDEYGHLVGDNVLAFYAKLLKDYFLPLGVEIVRYAGDEFALFCDGMSRVDAQSHIEKLNKSIQTKKLKTADGQFIKVTFSYGICDYKEGSNFQDVFDNADKKMYEMKGE